MFITRKRRGRTTYRHRPDVPELSELRRESVLLLPGRLRNVRLLDTDGFAIVHDTAQQTATLIATVVAPSFDYSPAHRQDAMVEGVASVMRGWTLRPGIKRFTQIARTSMGSVSASRALARRRISTRPGLQEVQESYEEMLTLAGNIVRSHTTEIAISSTCEPSPRRSPASAAARTGCDVWPPWKPTRSTLHCAGRGSYLSIGRAQPISA